MVLAAVVRATTPAAMDLGTLGGSSSSAYAISASGIVAGDSFTAGDAETHAFVWTQTGGMADLGTLGGSYSSASFVADSGLVAGSSQTAGGEYHAF
jgi:probable HAF family extracellular repeat protein